MYPRHLYGPGMQVGWGSGALLIALVHVLFWVLVVLLIVAVVRRSHWYNHGQSHHHQTPLDIAKARYARGEITKAELEDIKKTLA